jgi:hypothetical protein
MCRLRGQCARRRAGENAVPSPPSHVEARLRLRASQCRPRHTGAAGMARAQKHSAYGALHRAGPGQVQELLAVGVSQRAAVRFFFGRRLSLSFADVPRTVGCLQQHACHVAAGWALISDQSGLAWERLNSHDLVHYGFASRTCKARAF